MDKARICNGSLTCEPWKEKTTKCEVKFSVQLFQQNLSIKSTRGSKNSPEFNGGVRGRNSWEKRRKGKNGRILEISCH